MFNIPISDSQLPPTAAPGLCVPQTPPDGTAFPRDAASGESQKNPGDWRHPPGGRDLGAIAGKLPPAAQLSHPGLLWGLLPHRSVCPTDVQSRLCCDCLENSLENSLEKQPSKKSLVPVAQQLFPSPQDQILLWEFFLPPLWGFSSASRYPPGCCLRPTKARNATQTQTVATCWFGSALSASPPHL